MFVEVLLKQAQNSAHQEIPGVVTSLQETLKHRKDHFVTESCFGVRLVVPAVLM